jgi:predicted nuclease of predicted toxin-antitoxin system
MKLLVDAQLPLRLSNYLRDLGHDSIHTSGLPNGNRSSDSEIIREAIASQRIVVTKDRDFFDSYVVNGVPPRLLWVTTGNMTNTDLFGLFDLFQKEIELAFQQTNCVELSPTGLVIHA